MITAVAFLLILAWLFAVYHLVRALLGTQSSSASITGRAALSRNNPRLDLDRLRRDMALAVSHDSPPPELGELPYDDAGRALTSEEERETDLTRQLLAGTMGASRYQELMAGLAHHRTPSQGP